MVIADVVVVIVIVGVGIAIVTIAVAIYDVVTIDCSRYER